MGRPGRLEKGSSGFAERPDDPGTEAPVRAALTHDLVCHRLAGRGLGVKSGLHRSAHNLVLHTRQRQVAVSVRQVAMHLDLAVGWRPRIRSPVRSVRMLIGVGRDRL